MGTTGAMGFAEQVEEGNVSIRDALYWHLRSNNYPPLPVELIDTAEKAIELARDEEWEENIELPGDMTFKLRHTIKVWEAVESLHLDAFL